MNSHFAQSGLVFPQFWVFEAIFEVRGHNSQHLFCSVCTFYCTQNDRLNLTVSTQKSVWKMMHPDPRYIQNSFLTFWAKPNRQPKQILVNFSGNIGSFYKPIFALKPWDRAGHFEYHESYILSRKRITKFRHLPQKWSKKSHFAEKSELTVKNGYSFEYLWALKRWNQLKYPMHQNLCYTV